MLYYSTTTFVKLTNPPSCLPLPGPGDSPWPSRALLKPSSLGSHLFRGKSPSCWDVLDEEEEDELERERFFLLFLKAKMVHAQSFIPSCLSCRVYEHTIFNICRNKTAHTLISCGIWRTFPQISLCLNLGNLPHLFPDFDYYLSHGWNIFYGAQYPIGGPLGRPLFFPRRPEQIKTEHNVVDRLWISMKMRSVGSQQSWIVN